MHPELDGDPIAVSIAEAAQPLGISQTTLRALDGGWSPAPRSAGRPYQESRPDRHQGRQPGGVARPRQGGADLKVITKAYARIAGLDRYFTGEPCARGHVAERATFGGGCVECSRLKSRQANQKRREKLREAGIVGKRSLPRPPRPAPITKRSLPRPAPTPDSDPPLSSRAVEASCRNMRKPRRLGPDRLTFTDLIEEFDDLVDLFEAFGRRWQEVAS